MKNIQNHLNKPHFQTTLIGSLGETIDTYSLKVGIRTVTWTNASIYLNDKPIYLRGFGMHEDSDVSIDIYLLLCTKIEELKMFHGQNITVFHNFSCVVKVGTRCCG